MYFADGESAQTLFLMNRTAWYHQCEINRRLFEG